MSDCFHINPLQHGGTSQDQRPMAALDPTSAPIDGRSLGDLLLFAEQYGALLNFYDTTNKLNGDWKSFLSNDLSTILAAIIVVDYQKPLPLYYEHFNVLDTLDDAHINEYFSILFDIAFSVVDEIRDWNSRLVLKSAAKDLLMNEINTQLSYAFATLVKYYYLAIHMQILPPGVDFIDLSYSEAIDPESYQYKSAAMVLQQQFAHEWLTQFGFANTGMQDVINQLTATPGLLGAPEAVYGDSSWLTKNRKLYASSFYKTVFTNIYNSYVRIITTSKGYFNDSVTTYAYHSPHNGLMIAFFRLFGKAQEALNTFTNKHLNFYYHHVLRLNRKAAVADSANIVFTLAKNVESYSLDQGTQLYAGKDATGKELIYQTDKVVALNQGTITSLSAVFLDEDPTAGGVFAAAIANSADGDGKDLPTADPSWFAFGQPQSTITDVTAKTMTEASVGFIIASPILLLSEGKRVITVTINTATSAITQAGLGASDLVSNISVSITGKKGWLPAFTDFSSATVPSTSNAVKVDAVNNQIIIQCIVPAALDAIVALDPKIHNEDYSTLWPVLKVLLNNSAPPLVYERLSKLQVTTVQIKADVTGAQSCVLFSDAGSLSNQKPFMPFGPRPKEFYSFYFGSQEVMSKQVDSLTLNLNWLGLPTAALNDYYSYNSGGNPVNYLGGTVAPSSFTCAAAVKDAASSTDGSGYASLPGGAANLFDDAGGGVANTTKQLTFTNVYSSSDSQLDNFTDYSPDLRRGFIRLQLSAPAAAFGHDAYVKVFTQQVVKFNQTPDVTKESLPNEPYTPQLQPVIYNYSAFETITLAAYDNTKGQFYQLFPFGYAELKTGGSAATLLQAFRCSTDNIDMQGALYIGVQNLAENQQLNLYFEMDEGSEDGAVDPAGVYWYYLQDNQWLSLKPNLLSDTTNGMLGSGVITFSVPEGINEDNTLMPAGQKWIRAGVQKDSGAVVDQYRAYPKIYAVFTNAVGATFADNGNDPNHNAVPLPAETISKLYKSDASIKKVEQPYPSFDGSMQEASKPYYTRVSERLRHKNRAITIWDYERIILGQFSFLYKAKCLNHTNDVTETAPGCVRVIAIPDVSTKSTGDLLQPMISNNKRSLINEYITQLNCPFADTAVENPTYEAIRVNCQVQFNKDLLFDDYSKKLKADVTRFLAPWAFTEGREIDFGGSMHRAYIIKFMEDLSYVDFVTDVTLDLLDGDTAILTDVVEVTASTSKSILTSYKDHNIGNNTCQ